MAEPHDSTITRWNRIQTALFPWMREELDPLTEALERLIHVLDTIRLEAFVPPPPSGGRGRKPEDRRALARSFVAKAMLGLPTTVALIDRLATDRVLRRILGWEKRREVPSEATFSRAPRLRRDKLRGIRGDRTGGAHACGADRAQHRRAYRRLRRARCHRDRCPRKARQEGRSATAGRSAAAEGTPEKGRRAAEGTHPPGAAGHAKPQRHAGRAFHRVRCRNQEEQQGLQDELDRIQTPHRRGGRADTSLLPADLGVGAR